MTNILVILVDESSTLPSEVIDVVVAQFLRTDPRVVNGTSGKSKKGASHAVDDKQSTLAIKELPPAYNMAKTICNTCPDTMARHVSQYFGDVITDASDSSVANGTSKKTSHRRIGDDLDDSDMDIASGPTEEDLRELRKVHQLVRELWRACPAVLQNVIPQLEMELSLENVHLRSLATETFGDIISGIGAAGLPPPPTLDPAAYPPISISDPQDSTLGQNILTKPSSPQSFSRAYPQAYASFLNRSHDKSPTIRSAWTTGIGRILTTSAGGVSLSQQEEDRLVEDLARMLGDADEKVRIAAVKAVGTFSFRDVIFKLGVSGGVETANSVLGTLAERVRDKKQSVREEAMGVLGRLWGVASGDIIAGDERVIPVLGAAPSKILDTYYANDMEIHALLDHVLFEKLLPLTFPPVKAKGAKLSNGNSRIVKDSQLNGDHTDKEDVDPDKIRTERILNLVKDLDEKAKKVFFAVQNRQLMLAKVIKAFLQRCEDYNGGVIDQNEKEIKEHLGRLIDTLAKTLPDSLKVSEHLWKFAKLHNRRCYQLIRFCVAPESDYKTVVKAIKEFTKRIDESATSPQDMLTSLMPLLYRVSALIYNKSHVPAIMEYSRTDDKGLAATAHEVLREISVRTPEVLHAQVQEICMLLQEQAPSAKNANDPSAVDNLKACASFASKFASEIPKDRKFIQAMTSFALHGSPPEAAKHAVTIIMTATDKKELLAKELIQKCIKGFEFGADGFIARLAALSQLVLLAPSQANQESDAISTIAIEEIMLQVRTPSKKSADDYAWSEKVDVECDAKCWALRILVNRIRSHQDSDTISEASAPIYTVLSSLITSFGELSSSKDTPPTHKTRLRLLASRLFLKLCTKKSTDSLFTPALFNSLALVVQDPILEVRTSFLARLKKYLVQQKLSQRFYTIPFLLAFEPSTAIKSDTTTWLRSRSLLLFNLQATQMTKSPPIMPSIFARLLSLLAHHPDFSTAPEDLTDFARYILFYLHPVATEENLSIIYHIAQRTKQSRDAISPSPAHDDAIYHLSDLAQLTIRKFEDAHSWTIQTLPGKIRLPSTLYTEIRDHPAAQDIAEHNYLPEGIEEAVETLVKNSMRAGRNNTKKRRSDGDHHNSREAKKAKANLPIRKASAHKEKKAAARTPRRPAKARKSEDDTPASERRRSGRVKVDGGAYTERGDEEDDEEMGEGVAVWRYENGEGEEVEGGGDGDEGGEEVEAGEVEKEVEDEEVEKEQEGEEDEWDVVKSPPPQRKKPSASTPASRASRRTRRK